MMIDEIADIHPVANSDLFEEGFFESYTTAAVYTARRRRSGTLRPVAYADKKGGLEILHCNSWRVKPNAGNHEKKTTRFCRCYMPEARFVRGPFVDDRRPDAEMTLDGQFYYVEMDCGSMKKPEVLKRWQKYEGCEHDILVIAAPKKGKAENRLKSLMDWSVGIYSVALFATLEDVIRDPYGLIYEYAEKNEIGAWEWKKHAIKRPEEVDDPDQVENNVTPQSVSPEEGREVRG